MDKTRLPTAFVMGPVTRAWMGRIWRMDAG